MRLCYLVLKKKWKKCNKSQSCYQTDRLFIYLSTFINNIFPYKAFQHFLETYYVSHVKHFFEILLEPHSHYIHR